MESGFYRIDQDGIFHHAPNYVKAPTYTLLRAEKDTYSYPTEGGWYWFETRQAALDFFGIQDPELTGE